MFDDQGIERGQTIAPSLTEAIRESRISIVVLSKNYASSSWCLDELAEILECKEAMGKIVMTVFYGVDPSDVRKQTGEFGIVYNETCARKTEKERRRWSQALKDVGNIAGEHFLNWDNEAKMVEKIARDVSNKLNATPSRDFDGMVGLEAHLREMESLLDLDYNGVKMVGIFGAAGIGKTTIARALQSLISNRFQLTCFMENLKGSFRSGLDEYGLKLRLQKKLLSNILNQDGTRVCHLGAIKERLRDLKVLIILDDVNDVKQLEALANDTTWFGPGSRIIVSTQNKELLQRHGIDIMYHVGFPSKEEALKILCIYAFRQSYPHDGFKELAESIIKLCGNLPLGLRVVGSCLHEKNTDEWEYMLRKLETNIDRDIEDILLVGYESLDDSDQMLFLHIAVFFNHKDVGLVKAMLADKYWDIEFSLKNLVNRSLIYISTNGEFVIHYLLQQVGRQAIHRQEPWKRRILVDAQEICDVLENDTGTRVLSGISFNTSGVNEVILNKRALRKMCNLQFLRVYNTGGYDGEDRVHIPEEMVFPPCLRLLYWLAYPGKSLPLNFCTQNLVELDMQYSQLEKLWEGTQPLRSLKKMDLSDSYHLRNLPDLSNATNLKILNLNDCISLVELPSSIGNLHKLEKLYMNYCSSLEAIPTRINLASLETLDMEGCSQLRTFPDISTNTKTLYLMFTAVEELPTSIKNWSHLSVVIMNDNGKLKNFTHLPKSVAMLDLSNTDMKKIPDCIKGLKRLEGLNLDGCRKLESLPELPGSLRLLTAEDCRSLERVTSLLNTPNAELDFTNCFKLSREARRLIIQLPFLDGFAFLPGRVIPSEFNHKARGNTLTIPLSSSSSSSSKFKACVLIKGNQHMKRRAHNFLVIMCIVGSYFKVIRIGRPYESTGIRTEHLCIFHGELPKDSSEAFFDIGTRFYDESGSYDDDQLDNYEIVECGVRIMTNEPERISEDYADSSYEFELKEVLEDSTDCWS